MMVFPLSAFNRYFGNNPLETLTKTKNEIIQNGNPELTRKERETLSNDLIRLYKDSKEFSDKIGLVEGSIEDKLRKNELSESEVKSLDKWISENNLPPSWAQIDGVSYDEARVEVYNTSKSIDEFKTKYLEFQQKYSVDFKNTHASQKTLEEDKEKESEENKEKINEFKPIQGESKNKETYKDDNTRNELVKKLLEAKFSTSEELELLFGMKFNDDDTKEVNQFLSQNIPSKIVDIKV